MLKAKDIMQTDVVTVTGDMTVESLGRLFMEEGINGAPVLDEKGGLKGIVTENDLIGRNKRLHIPTVLRIFDAFIPLGGSEEMKREIKVMSATTVSEICTKEVIAISEETPIDEIATIMSEKRVHLIPVLREGKVVGVVGRHEVLKGISG